MTAQTVTGAVARRNEIDLVIGKVRNWQADIAMAAATHVRPSAVIRVTQGALRRNPKLLEAAIANPQSLLYALLDCARLGHEPDTDDYYLVPFGSEVTGIEGYKGIIERMYRAGGVVSVVAQVVRQRDRYAPRGEDTPPLHEYDDFADPEDRGPLRGAYAYAVLPGGQCSQVIRMGKAEIMRHKAKSRGSDKPDSPWQQWPEAMWKKTVLRALEPYVPTSTEYRTLASAQPVPHAPAAAGAPQAGANGTGHAAAPEPVWDAEIVPDGQPEPPREHRPAPKGQPAPPAALAAMEDEITRLQLGPRGDVDALIAWRCPGWTATRGQVKDFTDYLKDHLNQALKAQGGDMDEALAVAASAIWRQYREAQARDAGEPAEAGDG